jgi:TolB-like protein/DNA-binding winged helix-turn-helix (wHTH) protein
MPGNAQPSVSFGDFELDLKSGELQKNGIRRRLPRQSFRILAILLQRPGDVVAREELRRDLWANDTFVDFEHSLNSAIRRLREALADSAENPKFIETLPRLGYRYLGPPITWSVEPEKGSATPRTCPDQYDPRSGTENPRFVETLADRDYGFIAPVDGGHQTRVVEAKPTRGSRRLIFLVAFGLLAVIGTTAVLLGLSPQGWRDRLFVHAAKPRIQSLAVLPLANLSGDPEQEYFADGMTEALITELGKTNIPRVISRQSVTQYKGSKKPLQEIARELNADAVLEGTVVRSGDRVRVTVHLDRASPEGQLWASAYDRSVRDILGLQDEIARTVTDEIQVKLTPQERASLASVRPVGPEAHDDYLRGRYILGMRIAHISRFTDKKDKYTDADILAAIGHFKHAIEIDPAYAMAYAGLAVAYIQLGTPIWGHHSPKETLLDAKEAASKALDLDPSLPEGHFALALALQYDWNWSEAEKEFKLALKLNPNYADAHLEYGRFVQALGRNDEALREMNYAMELNPFDIRTKITVAWVTWASRQYHLALKQFESSGDDFGVIQAYRQKEMYPEALAAWERWKLDHPAQIRNPYLLAVRASIYGLQGRKQEAEALIDEMKEAARHQYVSGCFFAEAYVGLGQKDEAITWLERAYEEHDQSMVYIASYPGLDPLRSEPRFRALLRRMNFPQSHLN